MLLATPMLWFESHDHLHDYYFCTSNVKGITSEGSKSVQYPDLQSARRPIPHGEGFPVPVPPEVNTPDNSDVNEKNVI